MNNDAEENGPFSRLHHISIVVKDIEQTEKYYTSIGIGPFEDYPPMEEYVRIDVPDEQGFYNLVIKWAQIGPVQLQLIQPGAGESLYKDFLEQKGEGVYHLGFVVDDIEGAEREVSRLGVGVISSGRRENGSGFAYLDTAENAGVTLLIRQSPSREGPGCEQPGKENT
jgi:catechol 2,3-dioxygenase-like lactoylglutathione lyase family enzyme